jgi:hypothetical protein
MRLRDKIKKKKKKKKKKRSIKRVKSIQRQATRSLTFSSSLYIKFNYPVPTGIETFRLWFATTRCMPYNAPSLVRPNQYTSSMRIIHKLKWLFDFEYYSENWYLFYFIYIYKYKYFVRDIFRGDIQCIGGNWWAVNLSLSSGGSLTKKGAQVKRICSVHSGRRFSSVETEREGERNLYASRERER